MNDAFKKKFATYLPLIILVLLLAHMVADLYDFRDIREKLGSSAIYAQLSSDITQRPTSDKPAKMQMRLRDAISGVGFDPEVSTTNVNILHDGAYYLVAAPQVGRLMPDDGNTACANFFFTVNNVAVNNSNVTLCHSGPITKDVVITQSVVPLHAGDEVSIMISSSDPDLGIETLKPEDQPIVPSIIFSMFRIGNI